MTVLGRFTLVTALWLQGCICANVVEVVPCKNKRTGMFFMCLGFETMWHDIYCYSFQTKSCLWERRRAPNCTAPKIEAQYVAGNVEIDDELMIVIGNPVEMEANNVDKHRLFIKASGGHAAAWCHHS